MSKKIFAKPYRGVGEQVQQFADRGMVIDIPVDEAAAVLRSVTYYRFSGYALPFRDVASGSYTGDLKFSDVVALYRFDCRLRELVGNALGAVEVTLRTILADEFSSKYGPLGYLDAANFSPGSGYDTTIAILQKEFARSKQPCAEHFKNEYENPPFWAAVDVTTFGSVSNLLKELKREDQNAVSTHYGLRGDFLASYMHHATVLRNLCAHHCRVFDFPYSKLKTPPQEFIFAPLKVWIKAGLAIRTDRPLIYQLALIYHLLKPTDRKVFDREVWKGDICNHFNTLPPTIEKRVRGYVEFPKDAGSSPLWE